MKKGIVLVPFVDSENLKSYSLNSEINFKEERFEELLSQNLIREIFLKESEEQQLDSEKENDENPKESEEQQLDSEKENDENPKESEEQKKKNSKKKN